MHNNIVKSIVAVFAMLAGLSIAMAQNGAGARNTLYNKLDNGPGGPAPKQDLTGYWTGPLEPTRGDVPPMTPLGQQRFNLNKTEA